MVMGIYPLCQIPPLQVPTLHYLASQDDFRFQRSALQEALLNETQAYGFILQVSL